MKILRISLISMLVAFSVKAGACGWDMPERWYMFCFCEDTFRENYNQKVNDFWKRYCGQDWWGMDNLLKAAQQKNDTEMQNYLRQLKIYTDISDKIGGRDQWEYPTAAELSQRRQRLRSVVSVCSTKHNTRLGERWLLLQMRANMLLKDYVANQTLWSTKAQHFKDSHFKEMMRNIYANALLNRGMKKQAWNIYAEQNDQQSLLWSVRKYTNLAGIRQICAEDSNAPVLNYLLQHYMSRMQKSFYDGYYDTQDDSAPFARNGGAFAAIGSNAGLEARHFAAFAKQMAESGKSANPCMWMSASALMSYYMDDCRTAKQRIDVAMQMKGTASVKKMARRLRMLFAAETEDVRSDEFKRFITNELKWLDDEVAASKEQYKMNSCEWTARDRIINLGLARRYKMAGDKNMTVALMFLKSGFHKHLWDNPDDNGKNGGNNFFVDDEHDSDGFSSLEELTGAEMEKFFGFAADPAGDPLAQYIFQRVGYSGNYINDVVGTKYLSEGKFEKALTFLNKVPPSYLNKQAIAHFAYYRDYKVPAWYGWQTTGNERNSYSLNGNIKVRFCRDMLSLQREYAAASATRKQEIALTMAGYYFQASYRGQCWFLTEYYHSSYFDESMRKDGDFCDKARKYLAEAALSANKTVKAEALFGLAGTEWDEWAETEYDWDSDRYIFKPKRDSKQYADYLRLDNHLRLCNTVPSVISRCGVLKTFRKYR